MAVIFHAMSRAIPFAVLLLVLCSAPASAERLYGTYVVIGTAALGMMHAGVIVGLTSEPASLVPYAQLNLGLLTDDGSAMLIGGLGLDYYFTPRATAFAEVMPTFNIDSGSFFWLPIRLGMKYGI